MTIERVLESLMIIGEYSDEDIARYTPLARKNLALIQPSRENLTDSDVQRLAYLIGAKTNYEIALIRSQETDSITSFSAGDVKITQNDSLALAKEIYSSALEDAGGLIDDESFCFRSV